MELSQFIKNISEFIKNNDFSVVIFQGSVYPHMFFTQFFDYIKTSLQIDYKTLDIQTGDFTFKSELSTSFLGMQCLYWLGDASELKQKQKDELLKYLIAYQGPHKIFIFLGSKIEIGIASHVTIISMKEKYFFEDAKNIWPTYNLQQAQKQIFFIQQLYKIKSSFTLEELYILRNYQNFITGDASEFYESWITRLVTSDVSLYTLSQLLFEKKVNAFFVLWLQVKFLYSEMFWIAFWSDQVYRAYFFMTFMDQENFTGAKQVSFGLPFLFMKQTYKQYHIIELQNLHQAIFVVDTALKNGGNFYQLDQIYIDFFAGKFKNS